MEPVPRECAARSPLAAIALRALPGYLLFIALTAGGAHADGGKLARVAMDYVYPKTLGDLLGVPVAPSSTVTVAGPIFNIWVWRTGTDGTPSWTFKLTSPSGITKQQTSDLTWNEWSSKEFTGSVFGVWTAQVDNGPTQSWTVAKAVQPHADTVSTNPSPPTAGRPFVLTLNGTGFAADASLVIVGPLCNLCSIPNSALTTKTSTTLAGPITLNSPGTYSVSAPLSNSVSFSVNELVPTLTSFSTSPSPPVAHQQFTLTVNGADFNPPAEVLLTGPGCAPCVMDNWMLTLATSNTLAGQLTLPLFGTFNVSVVNAPGGTPSRTLPLVVRAGTPVISGLSVSPSAPVVGQPADLFVTGNDFDFATAQFLLVGPNCSPCIVANDVLTTKSANALEGRFTPAGAGTFTVSVQNGSGGTASNTVSFNAHSPAAPVLLALNTSVSPLSGQRFTLFLNGTGFDPANVQVVVSGPGCPCVIANGALTSKATTGVSGPMTLNGPGTFTVTAQNGSGGPLSNALSLVLSPPLPSISALSTSPSPPTPGQQFTLTVSGANFDPAAMQILVSGPSIYQYTIPNSALTTRTQSVAAGPLTLPSAGAFTVAVQNGNPGATSNSLSLVVPSPPITILGFSTIPSPPVAGQPFTVSLTGANFDPATIQVVVSGPGCSPCIVSNSALTTKTLTATAGPLTLVNSGSFTVAVQNGSLGPQSAPVGFTVSAPRPTLSAISTSPSPPVMGQQFALTLTGVGFDPTALQISVYGRGCDPCVIPNSALTSKTQSAASGSLTLNTPGSFAVSVQNGSNGPPSNSVSFAVSVPVVAITAISTSPAPPVAGQEFTLSVDGTNFDPSTAQILALGPGCDPCTVPNTALTVKTSNLLKGPLTLGAGAFTVMAQNAGTPASNAVLLSVGDTTPVIDSAGIVSAAGFQRPLSRGSVTSVFGNGLADATVLADRIPLPRQLGGVSVQVGGVDAPLWFVSAKQINFQIPYESPLSGNVTVVVSRNGVASAPVTVALHPYAPGVFTYQTPSGAVAPIITHLGGALVTGDNPALPGGYVIVWGTGIGDLTANPPTGDVTSVLAQSKIIPMVTLDGLPVDVQFSGIASGGIGLAQYNLHLPDSLPANAAAELVIRFDTFSSLPVKLPVGRVAP